MHHEPASKGPAAGTGVEVGFHYISIFCVVPVQPGVLKDSILKTGFRHLNDGSIFFLSYLYTDKFTKITKTIFLTWQGIAMSCAFST